MKTMTQMMKKIRKHEKLEAGRKQFAPLMRPTAYVFMNNVSVPVVTTL